MLHLSCSRSVGSDVPNIDRRIDDMDWKQNLLVGIAATVIGGLLLTIVVRESASPPQVTSTNTTKDVAVPTSSVAETMMTSVTATTLVGPQPTLRSPIVYLADIEPVAYDGVSFDMAPGTASVNTQTFPKSYIFEFTNCSRCTWWSEFNLSRAYSRFDAVIGLSDTSRSDNVIDGLVVFDVYSDGRLLTSMEARLGTATPISVNVTNALRLRLQVREGTNYEQAVWGDARISK